MAKFPTKITEEVVLEVLQDGSTYSSNEILHALKLPVKGNKPILNKLLYSLITSDKVKRTDSTPPRWLTSSKRRKVEESKDILDNTEPKTVVFIDVDNSPCLKLAEPYATGNVYIYAYASPANNNYHPTNTNNLQYHKLKDELNLPSAADVLFSMKMTELCIKACNPKEKLEFVIVSKDKILATMGAMHKEVYGVPYSVVSNGWVGLRHYLE